MLDTLSRRTFAAIGDGQLKQLNVKDYYDLGKNASNVETYLEALGTSIDLRHLAWKLWTFRDGLNGIMLGPCPLPSASQRAAKSLLVALNEFLPSVFKEFLEIPEDRMIEKWQLQPLISCIASFETILNNDMPEMSTYAVSAIGIFRTDDLVRQAELQITEDLLLAVRPQAKADIREAGKCLAFRINTASAFHICRAIETCVDHYYEELAGHSYVVSESGGNNNWGAKIKALEEKSADVKITEFLNHIRKEYRNPVTHPEVNVDENEAKDLFGTAVSTISMILKSIKSIQDAKRIPNQLPS